MYIKMGKKSIKASCLTTVRLGQHSRETSVTDWILFVAVYTGANTICEFLLYRFHTSEIVNTNIMFFI